MSSPLHKEQTQGFVPTIDTPVRTRDGKGLGTVKEVQAEAFKVDAPNARDYWLSYAFVWQTADDGAVLMDFDHERLDDYKLDAPGPHASESPLLDAESESFSTLQEKELRRERMESPQDEGGAL